MRLPPFKKSREYLLPVESYDSAEHVVNKNGFCTACGADTYVQRRLISFEELPVSGVGIYILAQAAGNAIWTGDEAAATILTEYHVSAAEAKDLADIYIEGIEVHVLMFCGLEGATLFGITEDCVYLYSYGDRRQDEAFDPFIAVHLPISTERKCDGVQNGGSVPPELGVGLSWPARLARMYLETKIGFN